MRKIYFLLFVLFSLVATQHSLFAQTTLTIPAANTNDGSIRQPLGTWYGFERSAIILTPAELNALGGSIQSIAFFVNSVASPSDAVNTRIYMKTRSTNFGTTATTYATETAGATLVYGPTTIPAASFVAGQWTTVTLATAFPYIPGDNLEIIIETNATGGGNEGQFAKQFRVNTLPSTSFYQTWNADNSAPTGTGTLSANRPNMQVTILAPPCVNPLNGGTTTGPATVACAGQSFNLSVTGASFGTGITYQWQRLNGAVWEDIPSATGAGFTGGQGSTTTYRRKMICSGGADFFSTNFTVSTTTPAISTFPWTENFDGLATVGTTSFPNCWFKQNGDWRTGNAGTTGLHDPRSAPNYLVDLWSATNEFIWTNAFQLTAGTSYDFSFWFAPDGTAGWQGDIYVNSAQGSGGASQLGTSFITATQVPPAGVYQEVKRTFVPATSGLYFFGIRVNAPFDPNYLAFDDFRLELTPPCSAPTGLNITNITNVSATVNWAASVTPPAGGYDWEVRSTGAAGSGATGLAASGTTAAGAVTANATGLLPNTEYTLYVRSACNPPALVSAWTAGVTFRTLCNTISTFPYTETFEAGSITRTCWTTFLESGARAWTLGAGPGDPNGTTTTAHGGTVNAQHFGNNTGTVAKFVSPSFDFSSFNPAFGAQLSFWYVNEDWAGDQNELRIYYRTSPAAPWTLIPGAEYTNNTPVWTQVELLLPGSTTSTYQIAFEGEELFGRGIGIDDIVVGPAPTCPKVANVSAVGVSPTSIIVSFTALPNTGYVVEYGAPGFVPGTGNVAGGGTVVFGATSPITINGLTANTNYDVYVRRICVIAPLDVSQNVKTTTRTLCTSTTIPYVQDFESAISPDMPTCTSMQDVNGNSGAIPGTTGGRWGVLTGPAPDVSLSAVSSLVYMYDPIDLSRGADDWFYTQGLNLTAGTSYRLKFYVKGAGFTERLEVRYGTLAHSSAMLSANTLYSNQSITSDLDSPWDSVRVDFTPAATGVYYLGFHAMSAADQAFLLLDDISVKATPLVDVGVTNAIIPTICPSGSAVLEAVIKNHNLTTQNFATYPVTVTLNLTGPSTASVSTTINTGTLAAAAIDTFALPGVSLVAGDYTAVITTSSPSDPETGNDSYTTTFTINPSPTVPVITPASPLICFGDSVRLETQFVTPPPAPVTMPLVSSGNINLAIPDLNATGINHTLAVSGVPATATVTNITVTVNVTHPFIGDIRVNLRAPNGKILTLINRVGGTGDNLTNTAISSTSTTSLGSSSAPFTGTFAASGTNNVGPTGYVSNVTSFAPMLSTPNGNWTLAVNDNGIGDLGTLDSWSISITYGTIYPDVTWSPVGTLYTDAATTTAYSPTPVSNNPFIYAEPGVNTTYTATTIIRATGCTSSANVTVALRQPTITFQPLPRVCLTDTAINLTASPAGGTWAGIGVQGTRFLPPRTGLGTFNATYTYVDGTNCANTDTLPVTVVDCPDRIIQLRDNAVLLYPNPNNGEFKIRINSTLYNRLNMMVFNSAGTLVLTQQLSGLTFGRELSMNLKHLPAGTYMVHFNYDGGIRTSQKSFKVVIGR